MREQPGNLGRAELGAEIVPDQRVEDGKHLFLHRPVVLGRLQEHVPERLLARKIDKNLALDPAIIIGELVAALDERLGGHFPGGVVEQAQAG